MKSTIIKLKNIILLTTISTTMLLTSCEKAPKYDIPSTYNFENVNYNGQTQRLAMLTEIKNYLTTANTQGVTLDANRLLAMFENDADNAQWLGTYEDSKQLKNKTFDFYQPTFEVYMLNIANASQSTVTGSNGQAGVVTSSDGTKSYLLDSNGIEYTQIIEKGLMGTCFYYQATAVYFGDDKMNVDNETVIAGEGTAMEHHWDEAFGYLGVPTDFPTNTDGLAFWGKYTNDRDGLLNCNTTIMNAFIKGRAAISNDDLATRDEAITEIRNAWEEVVASTALHYINAGIENFNDDALRSHALSEAVAFTFSLQFNPTRKVNTPEVNELLAKIGGNAAIHEMNLYNVTVADLEEARDLLASYFGWEDIKEQF